MSRHRHHVDLDRVCCLTCCLISGDVEQVEGAEKITIRVFKNITLVHEAGMVLLEVSGSGPVCPSVGASSVSELLLFSF